MKIIGITGRKRHGKGEVGNAITRLVPGAKAVGYADKLKISMMRSLGFNRPEAELIALADSIKTDATIHLTYREPGAALPVDHYFSGRELLQWFGTEGGRETFGGDFWIDQVLPPPHRFCDSKSLLQMWEDTPVMAITDVRFDNEAQRVLDYGGEMWEVIRLGFDDGGDAHASEAGVSPNLITRTIYNSSTLDHLTWKVECMLELAGALEPS